MLTLKPYKKRTKNTQKPYEKKHKKLTLTAE